MDSRRVTLRLGTPHTDTHRCHRTAHHRACREIGEGALIAVGLHPAAMDGARRRLESGARKAGRAPDSLEMLYGGFIHLSEDMDAARNMARPWCAQWAVEDYHAQWLRAAGLDIPQIEIPPKLLRLYPDIPHAEVAGSIPVTAATHTRRTRKPGNWASTERSALLEGR